MDQKGSPPDATKEETDSQFSVKILMSSNSGSQRDKILTDSDSESEPEFECKVCDKRFSGYRPFLQHEKGLKHKKALQKKKKSKELLEKIADAENASGDDDMLLTADEFAACEACNKEFGCPESYLAHLASKAHRKKVREASILNEAMEDGGVNLDKLRKLLKKDSAEDIEGESGGSEPFECKECGKSFSGLAPYAQHMTSKVHAKTVGRNKLTNDLVQKGFQRAGSSQREEASSLEVEDGIMVCRLCSVTFSGPENAMQHLKSRGHKKNLERFVWKQQKRLADISMNSEAASGSSAANEEEISSADESETGSDEDNGDIQEESEDVANEILPGGGSLASEDRPEESTATKTEGKSSATKQGSDEADRKAAAEHFLECFLDMSPEDIVAFEELRGAVTESGSEDTTDEDSKAMVDNESSELFESSLLAISREHGKLLRSSGAPTASGHQTGASSDFEKVSELYAAYRQKLKKSKDPVEET